MENEERREEITLQTMQENTCRRCGDLTKLGSKDAKWAGPPSPSMAQHTGQRATAWPNMLTSEAMLGQGAQACGTAWPARVD